MTDYSHLKTTTHYGLTHTRDDKINYYEAMKKNNLEKYKAIKALSIRQPWASLIVSGFGGIFKDIENRGWNTHYRGYLLIHAGKTFDRDSVGVINSILWDEGCEEGISENPADYDLGGFVGVARLNDSVRMDDSPWFFGPFGFKMRMPKAIEFIPYRGQLKLFDVPDSIIEKLTFKK